MYTKNVPTANYTKKCPWAPIKMIYMSINRDDTTLGGLKKYILRV